MKIWGRSSVVCVGLLCLSAARGQQYTIGTLAGNNTAGYAGDSGDPLSAELNSPSAVALNSKGEIFIADTVNHCVRKISGNVITTFAGVCGTAGHTGDDAAATSAYLSTPTGLAFDSKDNLYIVDSDNNQIRKVTGTTISTVAGIVGSSPGYGGDGGAATSANLNKPIDIAFDSAGNYYISDNGNTRIRKVDTAGIITTYIGDSGGSMGTSGKLNGPNGLVVNSSGALLIADSGNNRIAKFVAPTTFINFAGTLVSGFSGDGGQAGLAKIAKPTGIGIDAAGNIYFADTNNSRIRKITPDGIITTIAGKGGGTYSGDGGPATSAFLNFPRGIAIASNGTIYVADTNNHVIRVLTPTFPAISDGGVTNAASYAQRISPGALASVFGSGFGTATFTADAGYTWPTITPALVSVKVNGVAAPLYYVSPGQINFQVPWETPSTGSVNVTVVFAGGSSNTASVPVGTAAPGLFSANGFAIVQSTPSYTVNDASNPAAAGSTIVAYLTGTGPVSPAVKNGTVAPSSPLSWATSAYSAKIGSTTATVSFAGLTPGFTGLAQMNIVVPSTLTPGVYPLTVTIDGQTSNSASIAVK